MARASNAPAVHRVTTARRSQIEDQRTRMIRYCVLMSVRFVCFGLMFVTPMPWGALWAVGAVVLPYVAVLIANIGSEPRPEEISTVDPTRAELPTAQTHQLDAGS